LLRDEKEKKLKIIAERISICKDCNLFLERKKTVPGEGNPDASIVFFGEGPGFNEDEEGRPFVGAAGSLLEEKIKFLGLKRSDVFITNVIKCRPPGNRNPEPEEINSCKKFFLAQISIIKPKIVVTLGKFSTEVMIGQEFGKISQIHGQIFYQEKCNLIVFPTFHPAAALRNGDFRDLFDRDFEKLKIFIEKEGFLKS